MGIINTLLFLLAALLIPGIAHRTRARLTHHKGVNMLHPVYQMRELLRKKAVYPPETAALFRAAPPIYLGATILAVLFIPVGNLAPILSFPGDVVCFVLMLSLGRFVLLLADGQGESPEVLHKVLPELALTTASATLVLLTGYTSFERIFSAEAAPGILQAVVLLLTAYILLEIKLIQNIRDTHYQGIDRAMIRLGGWFKFAALVLLTANTAALSIGLRWWVAAPLAVLIGGFSKGFAETKSGRDFSILPCALAAVAFLAGWLLRLNIIHL